MVPRVVEWCVWCHVIFTKLFLYWFFSPFYIFSMFYQYSLSTDNLIYYYKCLPHLSYHSGDSSRKKNISNGIATRVFHKATAMTARTYRSTESPFTLWLLWCQKKKHNNKTPTHKFQFFPLWSKGWTNNLNYADGRVKTLNPC